MMSKSHEMRVLKAKYLNKLTDVGRWKVGEGGHRIKASHSPSLNKRVAAAPLWKYMQIWRAFKDGCVYLELVFGSNACTRMKIFFNWALRDVYVSVCMYICHFCNHFSYENTFYFYLCCLKSTFSDCFR